MRVCVCVFCVPKHKHNTQIHKHTHKFVCAKVGTDFGVLYDWSVLARNEWNGFNYPFINMKVLFVLSLSFGPFFLFFFFLLLFFVCVFVFFCHFLEKFRRLFSCFYTTNIKQKKINFLGCFLDGIARILLRIKLRVEY